MGILYLSRVHNKPYTIYCDGSLGDVCGYNTFSNTVRGYVKNLRKKFDAMRNSKSAKCPFSALRISIVAKYPNLDNAIIKSSGPTSFDMKLE